MSPTDPRLDVPDAARRDELAEFCGRAVRLDPASAIRLRTVGDEVEVWAPTPFDVLATASAPGAVTPADVTVAGSDLLAALSVVREPSVATGRRCDERWRAPLPADATWRTVAEVPIREVDALAEEAITEGEGRSADHLPAALLDRVVLTVDPDPGSGGLGPGRVPVRCLLALAGLGLLATGDPGAGVLAVSVGGSPGHDWIRLEVGGAAVVRRRGPTLVLRPV